MWYVWLLLGIFSGSMVTSIVFILKSKFGTLRIDHSNPQKDIYRLDISDLYSLSNKKRIILKIDNHADLSH